MKLKRLLINVLLIGGLSLTSCASYSTSDVEEIYNYILDKGLDISNWEGLNYSYTFKSDIDGDTEDIKMSVKVSHYGGEYKALITSTTKYSYTWGTFQDYQDKGTINMDLYSESDWSILRVSGKDNGDKYGFTTPYSYGRDEASLMNNAAYYLRYITRIIEDALSWKWLDSIKRSGSLRETGNGTNITFNASYKEKYDIERYGETTNYTDKEKDSITLKYDSDFYVSSFSITTNTSSKSSDYKENTKISVSASPYNKKISTPSWAQ